MNARSRRLLAACCLGAASFAGVALLHGAGLLERVELIMLDARYTSGIGRAPAGRDIVIAWIDQESMDYLAEQGVSFPWPRSVYADVAGYLVECGAKSIVFDLIFDQAGASAEDDRAFGAALEGIRGDVLAAKFMTSRTGARTEAATARFAGRFVDLEGVLPRRERERGVTLPVPEIEAGSDLLGFVNVVPDVDKVFRRYDLLRLWAPPGDATARPYPSLGLAAVLAAADPATVDRAKVERTAAGEVIVGAGPGVTAGEDARMLLNFRGPELTFDHVKFVNVFESINRIDLGEQPLYPPERFTDKIVIVGINAEGYEDIVATPTSRVFPGVEYHATAIDNLLRGDALRPLDWGLPLAAVSAGVATAVVFAVPGVVAAIGALAGLLAILFVATMLCWANLLVLPVAAPALGGALGAGSSFLWRLVVEGRQKREMRRAFSSYMAPEVLAAVLRDPGRVALGGESREVTLFFSDLAGFTGLSEHIGPEQLVAFLNDYFTRMCEPLLAEHGVIDKFIGDAIMAMFGAPLDAPDHALRAVRAALVASGVSERIAAELQAAGKPSITTRIGIHTGPAVVGNMGSAKRFDYTAIGDTVNLASRLEGANKAFGTRCLVSETAWTSARESVLFREVGAVGVKGRDAPIRVFEPRASLADASDAEHVLCAAHATALDRMRNGDRAAAARAFDQVAALRPGDPLARLYLERLGDPAWDGVFRLDSK